MFAKHLFIYMPVGATVFIVATSTAFGKNSLIKETKNFMEKTSESIPHTQVPHVKMNIAIGGQNKGSITLELDAAKAPKTVENFLKYVRNGFYNNTLFHRVIAEFMVQGGGFNEQNQEKDSSKEAAIVNESQNGLKNVKGSIAMARLPDPNSAKSQFFINLKDNSFLDSTSGKPGYAVFGKVIEGMNIIEEIAKSKTGRQGMHGDWPTVPVTVTHAEIVK